MFYFKLTQLLLTRFSIGFTEKGIFAIRCRPGKQTVQLQSEKLQINIRVGCHGNVRGQERPLQVLGSKGGMREKFRVHETQLLRKLR